MIKSAKTGSLRIFFVLKVGKFARVLIDQGVQKGDRVVIYMPMIPEVTSKIHLILRLTNL